MSGKERRRELLAQIAGGKEPISGADLAAKFGVSRQIIVQDIALLRASGCEILSTNRGYLYRNRREAVRVFYVSHTDEQMQDELELIVDFGGTVRDVFVRHEIYGELRAELNLSSRNQVRIFLEGIRSGKSSPLKNITSGVHYHTVTADSEETLDLIEAELDRHGYRIGDPELPEEEPKKL